MWWKTTSIYRARLPLDDMRDWAAGKVREASEMEESALFSMSV
jgi:hypothetical protein